MQTNGAVKAQPRVHDSQGASPSPRGPMDTSLHLVFSGPHLFLHSFAVLTDSLGWPTIENEVRAFRNLNAVPRGFLELSLAVLSPRDFLSTPPILARLDPAGNYQEGRESEAVSNSFSMEVRYAH